MKRLNLVYTLSFLFCLLATLNARAQQKGVFDASITFMSSSRTLSFFVPNDYDSTQKYQLMVGLHGLGDNSQNFRNALIVSLDWENHFPQTIFVCPDGGSDASSDFYAPEGDEEVIKAAMDYAMKNYHIDTDRVILEGFSLGGRSALKYGLDHPDWFFGLLLNTPAAQGAADADNDPNAGIIYNYANASHVPIFITNGAEDYFYLFSTDHVFNNLVMNNGKVQHLVVAGMGHNIPGFDKLKGVIEFFEDPATAPYDVDLLKVKAPQRTCSIPVDAQVLLRNTGSQPLTSAELSYEIQCRLVKL